VGRVGWFSGRALEGWASVTVLCLASLAAAGCGRHERAASAAASESSAEPAVLLAAADDFMKTTFGHQPSSGTNAGLHEYDQQFEDMSAAGIERAIADYGRFEERFSQLDTRGWAPEAIAARDVLANRARASRLDLEATRSWQKDPNFYAKASASAYLLISKNFAPRPQSRASVRQSEATGR
jgi:hypothetical protein